MDLVEKNKNEVGIKKCSSSLYRPCFLIIKRFQFHLRHLNCRPTLRFLRGNWNDFNLCGSIAFSRSGYIYTCYVALRKKEFPCDLRGVFLNLLAEHLRESCRSEKVDHKTYHVLHTVDCCVRCISVFVRRGHTGERLVYTKSTVIFLRSSQRQTKHLPLRSGVLLVVLLVVLL